LHSHYNYIQLANYMWDRSTFLWQATFPQISTPEISVRFLWHITQRLIPRRRGTGMIDQQVDICCGGTQIAPANIRTSFSRVRSGNHHHHHHFICP